MPVDLPAALRGALAAAGFHPVASEPLAGDVSPRRYYRLRLADGRRIVVASYPEEMADRCATWMATTAILESLPIRVPEILAADCAARWMALEDVGERTLAELGLGWDAMPEALAAAVEAASRISTIEPAQVADLNPRLGSEILGAELRQTWDLVLEPRRLLPQAVAPAFRGALRALVHALDLAPPRVCHRDFMARNLAPDGARGVVVLDHQDLRPGPPAYDLASLLNDTLYASATLESEVLDRLGLSGEDRIAYHRAAAQRCLKIAGTFEAFRRRGQDRHVPLIEPSLAAARRHLVEVPETAAVTRRLGPWPPE